MRPEAECNANPHITPATARECLRDAGELLFVPDATAAALGTKLRMDTFRFWNHAFMLRRHSEAAKLAGSADRIVDVEFSNALSSPLSRRCREVRQELDADTVARFPQAV